jgi:hypothetical protein
MGLFATIAVHRCPSCGGLVTTMGMVFSGEPELHVTKCPTCRQELQVRRDPISEELIVEKLKRQ